MALVGADRLNDFFDKTLGRTVADLYGWLSLGETIANCLEEVGLSEACFARNKERIVDAGFIRDGQGGGVSKLVAFSDDKRLEGVFGGENFTQNSAHVRPARTLDTLFEIFKRFAVIFLDQRGTPPQKKDLLGGLLDQFKTQRSLIFSVDCC